VQAPVAPAPKVAPKPVAKATEPVINYNSSVGREGEISTNLTNITTQDPNLTKDRGLFDQAFGYSTADSGKKAILDSFFQSKTVDQPRMDALKGLIGASETQLYDAMTGGTLTPGGEKWNDLIKANG